MDATTRREPLTRGDGIFIAVCAALAAGAFFIILRYFGAAFPEASIDFKHDRNSSARIAESLLASQRVDIRGMKHAAVFDSDDQARIFLERSLGLEQANRVMSGQVHVWSWHHRWFRPLQEEELSVDVAPAGGIVSFAHSIPEARALPDPGLPAARTLAENFLRTAGIDWRPLRAVAQSERKLPQRIQRIFTWESPTIRPANAPYQYVVTVDGNVVTRFSQRLKVPDQWLRSYRELRSKNEAAGAADTVVMIATMLAIVAIFVIRLRRGDVHLRFVLTVGVIGAVLVTGVTLNSLPAALAGYDTTTSYGAFLFQLVVQTVLQSIGTGMMLVVVCGAGEVLYRERLPRQLAMPRLWSSRALASKRVFRSLILGYALVPLFIAYQIVFYLTAQHYGAWSPADINYSDILNSSLPWVAVMFAGFFPAFSEEFMSRAFSIPFFQRFVRWRFAAIVIAGFAWGFGHSLYPNQPWWIRGVEVGIVGIAAGLLMDRFGLLSLLIWHYTIDALYTALLLFRSGNTYYVLSAGLATLVFAVPLVVAVVLYIRNRGFLADDELLNETLPVSAAEEHVHEPEDLTLPPPVRITAPRVIACLVLAAMAAFVVLAPPPSADDAIDYRMTREEAKRIATVHLRDVRKQRVPSRIAGVPAGGFRSWNANSSRQEGGSTGGFDSIAATHIARGAGLNALTDIFRSEVQAGTYLVRFFTPSQKEEYVVEVDPRTGRVIGYEKQQEEAKPGAQLTRDAALSIAQRAFPIYGAELARFELRDALTFQQPARRDWLFHFEERTPLAAGARDAHRRISVRVSGDEVTQFATHVKVPEAVYREAQTETILNVVALVLKLAAAVIALAAIIVGFIAVSRGRKLPWRAAAKWAALLSLIPIARALISMESTLFSYSTATSMDTYRFRLIIETIRNVGVVALLTFVAVAGLQLVAPYAPALFSRASRARFGRAAVVSAITAIALSLVVLGALQYADSTLFRSMLTVGSVSTPSEVIEPWPALFESGSAIVLTLFLTAAVALYASAMGTATRPWIAPLLTSLLVFSLLLDPSATLSEAPWTMAQAAIIAALVWLVARYVLGANPLAWPVTIFTALTLSTIATLLHHHRVDLRVNAIALMVLLAMLTAWLVTPREA